MKRICVSLLLVVLLLFVAIPAYAQTPTSTSTPTATPTATPVPTARFAVRSGINVVIDPNGTKYWVVDGVVDLPVGTWYAPLLANGTLALQPATMTVIGPLITEGGINSDFNVENLMLPSIATKSFTYTAAAGATYTGFVFPEESKILVHSVLVNVTTNFDCTGDDCTLDVGDASDGDGYIDLADAELQAADTEGTGFAAGWQGLSATTLGAYLDLNHNSFPVVAPAGGYTITYTIEEASGDTLAGGAATIYLVYTRIE